jgi:hypothetical protein
MSLTKRLIVIGLILLIIGCAAPGPQIEVKRTAGNFHYKTRIYENSFLSKIRMLPQSR